MEQIDIIFPETVILAFVFLSEDYNFNCTRCDERFVSYKSDKVFVNVSHDRISSEIFLDVGLLKLGKDTYYGLGSIIEITDPLKGKKFRCYMSSTPEGVKKGVHNTAHILRKYGHKVLLGDSKIFRWLRDNLEQYWSEDNARTVRPSAEKAFRDEDYQKAAILYGSIETCLTKTETKKLNYAKKKARMA